MKINFIETAISVLEKTRVFLILLIYAPHYKLNELTAIRYLGTRLKSRNICFYDSERRAKPRNSRACGKLGHSQNIAKFYRG